MTAYDDAQFSTSDGKPVELYMFELDKKVFRYTNSESAVTFEGNDYPPLAITRSGRVIASDIESLKTTKITVPSFSDIAQECAFTLTPSIIKVTVYSLDRDLDYDTNYQTALVGYVGGFKSNDATTEITIGSVIQTQINRNIASAYYQLACNLELYGPLCQVTRGDYQYSTTVAGIGPNSITVVDDKTDDGYLDFGRIIVDKTGESRPIISNAANNIAVLIPFTDIAKGDAVTLEAGCNHTIETCKNKFNNVKHFLGFPKTPPTQPLSVSPKFTTYVCIQGKTTGLLDYGFVPDDYPNLIGLPIIQNKDTGKYLNVFSEGKTLLGATLTFDETGDELTIVNVNDYAVFKLSAEIPTLSSTLFIHVTIKARD